MAQAQASPSTQATPAAPGRPLRVVLFGVPDAGKSSLLGALAQAARTQEHILNGRLIDKSQRLLELQRRLYEDRPRETLEEVTAYDVVLQPLDAKPGEAAAGAVSATLIDCDGRVANELLQQEDLNGAGRPLARAILDADTLVLAVDAATDPVTLKHAFGQFAQFLQALEEHRGERIEVGGLPVYLVLTKCDLLAQKSDSTAAWMERIEERKREVSQHFKNFLTLKEQSEQVPFGKVELNVWATAVKRPALADAPARPTEPYGVAELFRQCLESAAAYRERRASAGRRLAVTLGAAGAVVVALVLLMLVLVLSQPSKEATALNDEVRRYIAANDRPAERFQNLDDKLTQLQHFKDNPDFARLPEEYRTRVAADLKALSEYRRFTEEVRAVGKSFNFDLNRVPDDAEENLAAAQAKLKALKERQAHAAVPADYRAAWAASDAAQQIDRWLADLQILDTEKEQVIKEYDQLLQESADTLRQAKARVQNEKIIRLDDLDRLEALKGRSKRLAERAAARADEPLPGATEVKNALLYRLRGVQAAQRRWEVSDTKRDLDNYQTFIKGK
jgi:hypothetical protein